jgi:hypothetical protein
LFEFENVFNLDLNHGFKFKSAAKIFQKHFHILLSAQNHFQPTTPCSPPPFSISFLLFFLSHGPTDLWPIQPKRPVIAHFPPPSSSGQIPELLPTPFSVQPPPHRASPLPTSSRATSTSFQWVTPPVSLPGVVPLLVTDGLNGAPLSHQRPPPSRSFLSSPGPRKGIVSTPSLHLVQFSHKLAPSALHSLSHRGHKVIVTSFPMSAQIPLS